jgi:hypothetical protein
MSGVDQHKLRSPFSVPFQVFPFVAACLILMAISSIVGGYRTKDMEYLRPAWALIILAPAIWLFHRRPDVLISLVLWFAGSAYFILFWNDTAPSYGTSGALILQGIGAIAFIITFGADVHLI